MRRHLLALGLILAAAWLPGCCCWHKHGCCYGPCGPACPAPACAVPAPPPPAPPVSPPGCPTGAVTVPANVTGRIRTDPLSTPGR
jgi:hypothetical protein